MKQESKKFWGPALWKTIHCMAVAYKPSQKKAVLTWLYDILPVLIPCDYCRLHFAQNLKSLPPEKYLINNSTFFLWTYLLHDIVNKQLGKKSPPYSQVKNIYFTYMDVECESCRIE